MKRTSLWEIRERMVGTKRLVVASWDLIVAAKGGAHEEVGGGGVVKRD